MCLISRILVFVEYIWQNICHVGSENYDFKSQRLYSRISQRCDDIGKISTVLIKQLMIINEWYPEMKKQWNFSVTQDNKVDVYCSVTSFTPYSGYVKVQCQTMFRKQCETALLWKQHYNYLTFMLNKFDCTFEMSSARWYHSKNEIGLNIEMIVVTNLTRNNH